MNDKYSTTEGKTSEKLSDEAMLSAQWKTLIGIRQSGKSTGYKSGLSRQLSKRLQRSKTTSVSSDTFLLRQSTGC